MPTSRHARFPLPAPSAQRPAPKPALTLIEMLIGMAITLVMMAAVVTLFANLGEGVRTRRAGMEMNSQLRLTRARLFKDLAGATCPAVPWQDPGSGNGYLEIIEGQWSDKRPSGQTPFGAASATSVPSSQLSTTDGLGLGDYDDILALTVRSESDPFVGRLPVWDTAAGKWQVRTIESKLAEVIWFAVENPADGSLGEPGLRTVYRRVLLITPWVPELPPISGGTPATKDIATNSEYYQLCDVSFRANGNLRLPNTLSDLTKRENRFAHDPTTFPHVMNQSPLRKTTYETPPAAADGPLRPFGPSFDSAATGERTGEDVMLNDVLAFDLRVFDPEAELINVSGVITEPSDAGWRHEPTSFAIVGEGAYVDLNYWQQYFDYITYITTTLGLSSSLTTTPPPTNHPDATVFSGQPNAKSQLDTLSSSVYDTWSTHYEGDGQDQNNLDGDNDVDTGADEGTNGLDDDSINGTDDPGERETSPPYDVPLQGLQVKFRIYERDTRQIREATVTKGF